MKKLSFVLALACLFASFAFAGKPVCKNDKLFLKEGNVFYPAVYENNGLINFYDVNGNKKNIELDSASILAFRNCSEPRQKVKEKKSKRPSKK